LNSLFLFLHINKLALRRDAWIAKQRLGIVAIRAGRECVFHSKIPARPGEERTRSLLSEEKL
jgi:hypothetical protein